MEEEPSLDPELQKIVDMVPLDNMEDQLQFGHPCNSIESIIVNGGPAMVNDQFISLLNKLFENREDLISIVRRIGLMHGYVLIIKRSKTNRLVVIGCDRGGSYRTEIALDNRKRKSASRLIDCPFTVLRRRAAEGPWKVEIKSLFRNHEPSADMAGHPYCRLFTEEEALQVKQMSRAGIKPSRCSDTISLQKYV